MLEKFRLAIASNDVVSRQGLFKVWPSYTSGSSVQPRMKASQSMAAIFFPMLSISTSLATFLIILSIRLSISVISSGHGITGVMPFSVKGC